MYHELSGLYITTCLIITIIAVGAVQNGIKGKENMETVANKGKEAILIIDECEKNLPRNEHCHLIAVPDAKQNELTGEHQ